MKDKPMFEGFLRVYAEVPGYSQALKVATQLIELAQQHIAVEKLQVEPYWKIEEYFGIYFAFEVEDMTSTFDKLLLLLGSGWRPVNRYSKTHWAVWNSGEDSTFVNPKVRWANLEVFLKAEEPTQQVEQA